LLKTEFSGDLFSLRSPRKHRKVSNQNLTKILRRKIGIC
jgi:hypothetical protein